MGTISGFTAERSQEIEDGTITGGSIVSDHLILTRHDGGTVDAGFVRGGTIICTSTTRPSSPTEGMKIYQTDNDREYTYFGAAWRATNVQKKVVLSGEKIGISFTSDPAVYGSVSFGVTFAAPPIVQLTCRLTSNLDIIPNLQTVSATGFTYRLFQRDYANVTGLVALGWTAHGELP